ncbi:response regulator [Lysinibacillus sp. KU-BSD001]|uniref:response regulator n=1 Tax=Lysinibacillus sp. KU-BSD001 TaxID=3141328 RepID=UPI0036E314CD
MWKIVMVEDEQPILELHKRILEKDHLFQVIASFTSSVAATLELPKIQADAFLLDIEMPKMTGLELAQKLVEEGIDVPIIFSTAYAQYAVEAFRVQALDYVLKPMTPSMVHQLDERLSKYYGIKKQRHMSRLEVCLYGEAEVRINGQALKWPTKVTEELFYYLLVHEGKRVSKYRILDDLWPNHEEKRALANLYNTIYRLRQLFTEHDLSIEIERINDGYELKSNHAITRLSSLNSHGTLLETKGYLWAYAKTDVY